MHSLSRKCLKFAFLFSLTCTYHLFLIEIGSQYIEDKSLSYTPCQLQHRSSSALTPVRPLHNASRTTGRPQWIWMRHIFHQQHRWSTKARAPLRQHARTLPWVTKLPFIRGPLPFGALRFILRVRSYCVSCLRWTCALSSEQPYDRFWMFWFLYTT